MHNDPGLSTQRGLQTTPEWIETDHMTSITVLLPPEPLEQVVSPTPVITFF